MKILFSTNSLGFLRNFQSTVRLLAARGHRIHIVAERGDTLDGQRLADTLAAEHPGAITWAMLPSTPYRLWHLFGGAVRGSLDYWRYLDPRWERSEKLRARGASMAPAPARLLPSLLGTGAALRRAAGLLRGIDRALPPPREVLDAFDRFAPDLLLLTPLLYFGSHQVDYVRAARLRGVPSAVGIGSWDHLTTKGLLHEIPDRVLVWNEAQKTEAIEMHGVAASQVTVTGAQAYDHWFAMTPSTDRQTFCAKVGLDPGRPLLLYLCSSPFIAPDEVSFVRRWIAAVRASGDTRLARLGLLVRPHPQNARQWRDVDLAGEFDNVALYPKAGVNPIDGAARGDYFDAMYHADAVVGVNTSGMIESGIVGRPVFTVQADEFAATQDGTLHFHHLRREGLLHLAGSLAEHIEQLGQVAADPAAAQRRTRDFVGSFVRPHGLDVAATPRVVADLEALAALPSPAPRPVPLTARIVRIVLAPAAVVLMMAAVPGTKRRAILLHWTRPVRLAFRAAVSRSIYAARFIRRLPGRSWRVVVRCAKWVVWRPLLWLRHRARAAIHAVLTWRKGAPDEVS
jgi:hypothetical protein